MTVLPSPIPHPLDYSPFDVPGWAYEALEWIVGFDWPAGNEVSTWDVADRWFVLAGALAEPRDEAFAAASQVLSGYGGAGITADGFQAAWQQLAGDENAPLNALLQIAQEVGELVEECGTDLEAAKLEAWIEIGLFLIEVIGMTVAVALTLGAATPAAGGLIMATRLAVQQIFKRLIAQLGRKALKQSTQRAVRDLTSRQGLRKLGRGGLREGFDEAGEEALINASIQGYQQTGGRKDGFDLNDLGMSAAGGFAGGMASRGADIGSNGHGGSPVRGAGGEVLAEFGAAAVHGDLPSAESLAKSAGSGAAGSTMHSLKTSTIDLSAFGGTDGGAQVGDPGQPVAAESGMAVGPITAPSADNGAVTVSRLDAAFAGPTAESLSTVPSVAPQATAGSLDASFETGPTPSLAVSDAPPLTIGPDPAAPALTSEPSSGPVVSDLAQATASSSPAPSSSPSPSPLSSPSPSPDFSTPASASPDFSTPASASPDFSTPASASPDFSTLASASPTLAATAFPTTAPADLPPASAPSPATSGPITAAAFPAGQPPPPPDPGTVTRHFQPSDLDRIANALAPRPIRQSPLPDLSVLNPGPPKRPTVISAPLPDNLDRAPRRPVPPPRTDVIRDEAGYFGYAAHARRTHELNRREDYVEYLAEIAEDNRIKILDLGRQADAAFRVGSTLRGTDHRRRAAELSIVVDEIELQIDLVRAGELAPATVEVDPPAWARINTDVGNLAPGGILTDDRSALPGGRPPIDRARRYHSYGGLRPPLAVHQLDLENAVPRDHNGRAARLPDPRTGNWFRLANDGGPEADSTRGLNCVDGVLALYDTYLHARPRVSAPRTFDAYAHGNPDRPLGGEWNGVQRIEQTTGSTFQNLCPYVGAAAPAQAKPAVDTALRNLTNHLHNNGHGAYAFIVTDLEGGGCHSWAAVNQNGTILFLDPQVGKISEDFPLYRHHGVPTGANIVSMDALVLTGEGKPAPLPFHGPGQWRTPTGTPGANEETSTQRDERLALGSLTPEHRRLVERSVAQAEKIAAEVSRDLHRVLADLPVADPNTRPTVIDEDRRVKTAGSLARKFKSRFEVGSASPEAILGRVKDRVRFAVQVPAQTYGESVRAVLHELQRLGYHSIIMESFWAGKGRHSGLNVNLTRPDGFVFEIQFPTPLSAAVGHDTHSSYEDIRRDDLPIETRVAAFLRILHINKVSGIYDHQPQDLELLRGFLGEQPPIDTTLAAWLTKRPGRLEAYREHLAASGRTFEEVLREHGLEINDVPGTAGLGLIGD